MIPKMRQNYNSINVVVNILNKILAIEASNVKKNYMRNKLEYENGLT